MSDAGERPDAARTEASLPDGGPVDAHQPDASAPDVDAAGGKVSGPL